MDWTAVSGARLPFCVLVGTLGAGCSFVLDWDPKDLPCLNGECAQGFSCLVNKCVEDGQLALGETCNKNQQCEAPLLCAPNLFTCRRSCPSTSFYEPTTACVTGEYCKPVPTDTGFLGVCVDDECSDDTDCGGDVCVQINTFASACLPRCQVTWPGGTYTDSCGGTQQNPRYCTPIGSSPRLVCVDTTPLANTTGPCDATSEPCRSAYACYRGCRAHCDTNLIQCSGGTQQCCPINLPDDGTDFGVCADDCSGL